MAKKGVPLSDRHRDRIVQGHSVSIPALDFQIRRAQARLDQLELQVVQVTLRLGMLQRRKAKLEKRNG